MLPIELPEATENDSYMLAQTLQQNAEQLRFQCDAIDMILDVISKESDLLREKYAPTMESIQDL